MGKLVVEVCAGTYCTMMGSMDIVTAIESLKDLKESTGITCDLDLRVTPCTENNCQKGALAPVVKIGGELLLQTDTESVMSRLLEIARRCEQADESTGANGK